jgi:hypothetical protein
MMEASAHSTGVPSSSRTASLRGTPPAKVLRVHGLSVAAVAAALGESIGA